MENLALDINYLCLQHGITPVLVSLVTLAKEQRAIAGQSPEAIEQFDILIQSLENARDHSLIQWK